MTPTGAKYSYCFVVTYGRSGSTLLQGVLNAIPGYVIRGENGGILYKIHELFALAEVVNKRFGRDAGPVTHPWYGVDRYPLQELLGDFGNLFINNILTPPPGTRCLGFKEIRYGQDVMENLYAHLDFMDALFPRACFIFNSRNLEDTARSSWWKREPGAFAYLLEFERRMHEAFDRGNGNYFWVKFDDYVENADNLRPLFEFLEEPFDREAVAATLRESHGLDRQTYRAGQTPQAGSVGAERDK